MKCHSEYVRSIVVAAVFLFSISARVSYADAPCPDPSTLRVVILSAGSGVLDDAKPKYNLLISDVRGMLVGLRSMAPELSDPSFAYLDRLKLELATGNIPGSLSEMDSYLRDQRPDVLELVYPVIDIEGTRIVYKHGAYLGPDCGLSICMIQDRQWVPPSARYTIVKEYYRILTLYALAVNAIHARCNDNVAGVLLQTAIAKIDELQSRSLEFEQSRQIKADAARRLRALQLKVVP